jgi:hypothetical protein
MQMKTSDLVLILIPSAFALVAMVIIVLTFSGLISKISEVNAEVINGLLTVSGVIFAFQATYFRKPRKQLHQILFTAIFVVEITLLGLSGFAYVKDISDFGYPSTYTLFVAFSSMIYNILITGFFVLFDLYTLSFQHIEEIVESSSLVKDGKLNSKVTENKISETKKEIEQRTENPINRETEFFKIQVFTDRIHTFVAIQASLAFVLFSFASVFYGLYYDGFFNFKPSEMLTGYYGAAAIIVLVIITVWYIVRGYVKNSVKISDMIEAVNEGTRLPSLIDLPKWKKGNKQTIISQDTDKKS